MRRFLLSAVTVVVALALQAAPAGVSPSLSANPTEKGTALLSGPETGSLVQVGGGTLPDSVRQRFLDLAGGRKARLVLIPPASSLPEAPARSFAFWSTADVASVRMLHATSRAQADDPALYGLLRDATGVWMSGGDQSRLVTLFGGTAVEQEMRQVLRRGG